MSDKFMAGVIGAQVFGIIGALAGLVAGAFLVWNHAPVVGGEWWPYVHVVATAIGGVIGAKIGVLVGMICAGVVGLIVSLFA